MRICVKAHLAEKENIEIWQTLRGLLPLSQTRSIVNNGLTHSLALPSYFTLSENPVPPATCAGLLQNNFPS